MYYSLIGTALTVIIGVIISYLTQNTDDIYDAKLLHPLVFRFCERFVSVKPYYINKDTKDTKDIPDNVDNELKTKQTCNNSGAKINHGFQLQNELNINELRNEKCKDSSGISCSVISNITFTNPINANNNNQQNNLSHPKHNTIVLMNIGSNESIDLANDSEKNSSLIISPNYLSSLTRNSKNSEMDNGTYRSTLDQQKDQL